MKRFNLFFLLLMFSASLFGLTNWTGNVNNDWFNPGNWDNGLPGPGNDALIPTVPIGGLFPEINAPVIQNYTIDNRGTLTIVAGGSISNSSNYLNRNGAFTNINAGASFTNGAGGVIDNYGVFSSQGTVTNTDGQIFNYANSSMSNGNSWFNNGTGTLSNAGFFFSMGTFSNMAQVTNSATFDIFALFNNNGTFINNQTGNTFLEVGAEFRNNLSLFCQGSGFFTVLNGGNFNNFGDAWNQENSTVVVNAGGTINNSVNLVNRGNGQIINNSLINNFFCATIINESTITNFTTINNDGFIWNYGIISPNMPNNLNNGVTITPGNPSGLCTNVTRALDGVGTPIVVLVNDLVNPMMPFCIANYSFNVNGANSVIFDCSNFGVNMVSVTINGPLGYSINCTAEVTITDPHPAQPFCIPATIEIPAGGVATVTPIDVFGGGFDNCGIINLVSVTPNMFYCAQLGTHTVALNVNDGHGNMSSCNAQVTITDTTPPTLLCQNANVTLDANGNASISEADVIVSKDDNCGIMSTHISQTDFTCDDVGSNQVTVKVTDHSGLMATCLTSVTVVDDMAPVLGCQPQLQGHADQNACGTNLHPAPPIILAENCGIANITSDSPGFFPVGTTIVTWTVVDNSGNTSTCTQEVVVWDWVPPSITCNSVVYNLADNCVVPGTVVNNFPPFVDDNCGIESVTHNGLPAYLPGNHVVVWTAVDVNGNANTCEQWVKVMDLNAPEFTSCPDDIEAPVTDLCTGPAFWSQPNATDNCGVASIEGTHNSGDIFDEGTTEVVYTATDVNGNESICSFNVTIADDTSPLIYNAPEDIYLTVDNCGEMAVAEWTEPLVSDNCGVSLSVSGGIQSGDEFPTGVTTITYKAIDASGNEAEHSFEVHVESNLQMKCPDDIYVSGGAPVAWNDLVPGSVCEDCPQAIEGYTFFGWHKGHQYYISNDYTPWDVAQLNAEINGGHLAIMDDQAENFFVSSFMGTDIKSAWIGLRDYGNGFDWGDESGLSYNNWVGGTPASDPQKDAGLMKNNGTWINDYSDMNRRSIIEVPCFEVELTGSNGTGNGDYFNEAIYTITYDVMDMCGNICECSFDIHVVDAGQKVDYCTIAGDGTSYVSRVALAGGEFSSANDNGYGNHTAHTFTVTQSVFDLELTPGGVDGETLVFWRVWVDFNQDGDFYDKGEMVYQASGKESVSQIQAFGNLLSEDGTLMRVAASQNSFVEACGDYISGEVEDFTIIGQVENKILPGLNNGNTVSGASLAIYPNPASNVLNINTLDYEGSEATMRVFNSLGQKVYEFSTQVLDVNVQLNLEDFNDGVYRLVLDAEGQDRTTKTFVVAK